MKNEINALRELSTTELVNRYVELFGKPPRVKHRECAGVESLDFVRQAAFHYE